MKHQKVVSNKNLPTRLPITLSIWVWLLLDRLKAASWVWGVVGTLVVILWAAAIFGIIHEDRTDLRELQ
jgi:hypothetical protein